MAWLLLLVETSVLLLVLARSEVAMDVVLGVL
jgi:hypothetical protein